MGIVRVVDSEPMSWGAGGAGGLGGIRGVARVVKGSKGGEGVNPRGRGEGVCGGGVYVEGV